jgi:hypothetical protein
MAKDYGKKGMITIIGICATIIGMLVGGSTIKGRLTTQAEERAIQAHLVEDTAKAVETVKIEGCDPARQQKQQIAVGSLEMSYVQSDVEELKDDVASVGRDVSELKDDFGKYQIEQKIQEQANTAAILKAIEDKP